MACGLTIAEQDGLVGPTPKPPTAANVARGVGHRRLGRHALPERAYGVCELRRPLSDAITAPPYSRHGFDFSRVHQEYRGRP